MLPVLYNLLDDRKVDFVQFLLLFLLVSHSFQFVEESIRLIKRDDDWRKEMLSIDKANRFQ